MSRIQVEINGQPQTLDVPPDMPLLWVLRDVLNLTGTKYGCGVGVCGACVVHVNGRKEQSCQFVAERVDGTRVTTIEGLSPDGHHPLQSAWLAEDVPQCGYCQAGQIMQAAALMARKPKPSDAEIDGAMVDNVCRCGTYQRIRAAIHRAAGSGLVEGEAGPSVTGPFVTGPSVTGPSVADLAAVTLVARAVTGPGSTDADPECSTAPTQASSLLAATSPTRASLLPATSLSQGSTLTRRQVIQGAAVFQLALVLGGWDRTVLKLVHAVELDAGTDQNSDQPVAISAWIAVAADESVTITVSKSEMGQGIRTSLAMIVAEELDADWSRVRIQQAPANAIYGNQMTVGSGSTRGMWSPLRTAGATARTMLVAAAAQIWGVPADSCGTEPGVVVHASSGRRLTYGALAARAAQVPVPPANQVTLKDPGKFRIVGQGTDRVDNTAVVTGKATYGMDVRLPGMLHAVIARSPVLGGKVTGFKDAAALAVPGVKKVVQVPTGVAVLADTTWAALEGRAALELTLDPGPNAELDDAKVRAALEAAVKPMPDLPAGAARTLSARYDLPYLAHATMEPMNCVADVRADSCVVWAPTQGAGAVQQAVAGALGRQAAQVTVNVTLMGGGFGRRSASDFAVEAAQVSRAAGVPVQVTWTRADDMQNDLYRPASTHTLRAALDDKGQVLAWQHYGSLAVNGGGGASPQQARAPYRLPSPAIDLASIRLGVPTGFWRSVALSQLVFANESFMDEMAAASDQDPFEMRRGLLDDVRLRAVLVKAAAESGWGEAIPAGEGRGIACVSGFGSFCAVVVQAAVAADGVVKVKRVTAAVDVGVVINPRTVEAQVQGAVVDGLATALKAEITLVGGAVQQSHFNDYAWFRMPDMPVVAVHILPSSAAPGGVGELGYPPTPPALANAIFAATGKRVRRLPMRPADVAGGTVVPTPQPTARPTAAPTAVPTQPSVPTVPSQAPNRVFIPRVEKS